MADGEKRYVQLPDSSYIEFPADMSDDSVNAAVAAHLGETPAEQAPPHEFNRRGPVEQTARGITKKFTAPVYKGMQSLRYLLNGDLGAAGAAGYNALTSVPGAALAVTDWIPGQPVSKLVGAMSQPGVNLWNAARPKIEGFMDENFPNRPRLFSSAAGREADELGRNMTGALSATAIGETAGAGIGALNKARGPVADMLSEGAYKVPPTVREGPRSSIIDVTQRYNIAPTKSGLAKLDEVRSDLLDLQQTLEDNARTSGAPGVPKREVIASLNDVIRKWAKSDLPRNTLAVIRNYRRSFLKQNKDVLTMDDMISMKRNLQEQLAPLYDKALKINPGLRETIIQEIKGAVENDLRARLEDQIPGYKEVNKEFSDVLEARPYIERAVNRVSNYDLLNLRDLIAAGGGGIAGALLGHAELGALLGMIAEKTMMRPANWSRTANAIAPAGATSTVGTVAARGAVPAGIGAMQGEQPELPWLKHPAGFEYQIIPEGK